MIYTEEYTGQNGKSFRRTYSDGYVLRKVGTDETYTDAVDVLPTTYTYVESDVPLDENVVDDATALAELLEVIQ
jgi:hypothetical protein